MERRPPEERPSWTGGAADADADADASAAAAAAAAANNFSIMSLVRTGGMPVDATDERICFSSLVGSAASAASGAASSGAASSGAFFSGATSSGAASCAASEQKKNKK